MLDEFTWHPYGFRCVRKENFLGRLRSLFTTRSSKASCIVTRQVEVHTSAVRITAVGLCVLRGWPNLMRPIFRSLLYLPYIVLIIRWKRVIYRCIDGYSRRVIYLQASDNNRSDTVIQLFVDGISKYGIPSQVRVTGEARMWV